MSTFQPDLEHIRKVAKALTNGTADILDRPLGPDELCLSPQQFVTCLEEGVSKEQEKHLFECQNCKGNLTALKSIPSKSGRAFVEDVLRKVRQPKQPSPDLLTSVSTALRALKDKILPSQPIPIPAFIVLEDPIFAVEDAAATNLILTCDLIPGFEPHKLGSIQSLRLDGAIMARKISYKQPIDINHDGLTDVLRITFEAGKLAPRIRKAIEQGQSVVDTIRLTGDFTDDDMIFLGQARLEFRAAWKEEEFVD